MGIVVVASASAIEFSRVGKEIRNNMSKRLSIGGRSTLRDASSRHNVRSSSTPRRQSFGGNHFDYHSDGDMKSDRQALLSKWRRERGDGGASIPVESEPAAKPPSSGFASDSRSALERYRDRKRKERQQNIMGEENVLPPTHPQLAATRSTICYDDDEDYGRGASSLMSSGTPSFNRRLGGSASKARRRSYSVGARGRGMTLSQENEGTIQRLKHSKFIHDKADIHSIDPFLSHSLSAFESVDDCFGSHSNESR